MKDWEIFKEYSNRYQADTEAEFLEQSGIPAKVKVDEPIPGLLNRVSLIVPTSLLHKAKSIMQQQQDFTDEELTYLAMQESKQDDKNR